jgi:hypothetical protein
MGTTLLERLKVDVASLAFGVERFISVFLLENTGPFTFPTKKSTSPPAGKTVDAGVPSRRHLFVPRLNVNQTKKRPTSRYGEADALVLLPAPVPTPLWEALWFDFI